MSTFSTISGSRNYTISTVSGSRIFFCPSLNFWIQKQHHFYNFWIQKFVGQFSQFLDPETALFFKFLDPETAPFLQFLDCHSITCFIMAGRSTVLDLTVDMNLRQTITLCISLSPWAFLLNNPIIHEPTTGKFNAQSLRWGWGKNQPKLFCDFLKHPARPITV